MSIFSWLGENSEPDVETERANLMNLNEKEILIEIILELKRISEKCDNIGKRIVLWSN